MMRRRYELTDKEWLIIEPLLPNKPRGVPRVDDRRVLNGILWRFRPVRLGQRFRNAMGRQRPATIGSSAGERPVFGIGCWRRFPRVLTASW